MFDSVSLSQMIKNPNLLHVPLEEVAPMPDHGRDDWEKMDADLRRLMDSIEDNNQILPCQVTPFDPGLYPQINGPGVK